MKNILFIGDEISASGFRLAGLDVLVPESGNEPDVLDRLNQNIDFVIITAEVAKTIPIGVMNRLIHRDKPLLLVMTDMRELYLAPDLSGKLRSQLGMKE